MNPKIQGILRSNSFVLFIIALVFAGGAMAAFDCYLEEVACRVTLNDNGHIVQVVTMEKTVGGLLKKAGITLGPGDEVAPGLDEGITEDMDIDIARAFKVSVVADNDLKSVYLTKGTVADVLGKAGVTLGKNDLISHRLYEPVAPGALIKVTRVDEKILVEKEPIPYKVVTRKNHNVDEGVERVVQQGRQGEVEKKILVVYRDGVEVSRRLIEERVAHEPVDRVVELGTVKTKATARGDKVRYTAVKTFQATAYTHTGNRTRTGIWPKEGIIAVDPKVIPLYTTVYVEFPKGWEHLNGFYRAMDTGGAIKGQIIDVFMDDKSECYRFGRRKVKVYFLK